MPDYQAGAGTREHTEPRKEEGSGGQGGAIMVGILKTFVVRSVDGFLAVRWSHRTLTSTSYFGTIYPF